VFEFHGKSDFRPEQVLVSVCWKRELVRARNLGFTAKVIFDQNKFWFPKEVKTNLKVKIVI